MANTGSMTKKLKKCSTSDSDGSPPWSNLDHDLLFLTTMCMGVFDFLAVSRVCKSWKSFALDNGNKFMVSKQPMRLSISTRLDGEEYCCYLEDEEKRKLNTTIPHSNAKVCVGVTCGYLIFFGKETHDFWLVNPFTMKQLHFPRLGYTIGHPCFLFPENYIPREVRGILVFSPSMSTWVFVVSDKCSSVVSFCLAGEQARWTYTFSQIGSSVSDLHFFKGKIYTMNTFHRLCELRLYPEPELTLLKMKNFPMSSNSNFEFVSSCENLYVRDISGDLFQAVEADFDGMEWVNSERTQGEYEVFVSNKFKCGAAIKPDTWTQYERLNFPLSDRCLTEDMWYYPHECLKDMEKCAMLNILKEDEKNKKHDENLH